MLYLKINKKYLHPLKKRKLFKNKHISTLDQQLKQNNITGIFLILKLSTYFFFLISYIKLKFVFSA